MAQKHAELFCPEPQRKVNFVTKNSEIFRMPQEIILIIKIVKSGKLFFKAVAVLCMVGGHSGLELSGLTWFK